MPNEIRQIKCYVDGSYSKSQPEVYGWGVSIYNDSGLKLDEVYGHGTEFIESWQIGGECEAVLQALEYAALYGVTDVVLYHDYIGLSHWAQGTWKTNKDVSKRYKAAYCQLENQLYQIARKNNQHFNIQFVKVKGHSNNMGNDDADRLANMGRAMYYN